MRDLNKIIVSGRATKDAEYKEINDRKIATFCIACNYGELIDFFPVTCYAGLAEKVVKQYVTKGKALQVEGRLKQERWQKDGVNHSKLTIVAQKINLQSNGKSPQEKATKAKN